MNNTLILDTGVVGGLLSKIDSKSEKWIKLITELISYVGGDKFAIPTPVWFEIAQWHVDWYKKISSEISNGSEGIYQYAGYSIQNSILMDAAWYKCQVRQNQNNPESSGIKQIKDKISMCDALIAAYCLRFGYYLVTLNQSDFPEKFFETIQVVNAPTTTEFQRNLVFLLKPKTSHWSLCKKPTN